MFYVLSFTRLPCRPYAGQRTGIFSCKRRLMPIVMVVIDEGHEPHAPFKRRYTIGPSISASSTLPPSAIATSKRTTNHPNPLL